jgi:hypothetical protein
VSVNPVQNFFGVGVLAHGHKWRCKLLNWVFRHVRSHGGVASTASGGGLIKRFSSYIVVVQHPFFFGETAWILNKRKTV